MSYSVIDLFCGAGGLALGFIDAGFEVIQSVDSDEIALKTYNKNVGNHGIAADISAFKPSFKPDVIIGGPPCQGFSSAGLRKDGDRRNSLVSRFAKLIAEVRPRAFVFENVEGFLTAEQGTRVVELLDPLINAGYRIHLRKINAANYGVPQHRKRVIAIGGLGWNPSFPEVSHAAFGAPGAHRISIHLPPTPSLEEAFEGLPEPTLEVPGIPQGHVYKHLKGLDMERATLLEPGQSMRDLPEELQHESFRRRANRRVSDGTPTEKRGGAPTGIRRLIPDQPSKAITGGAQSEFLHPYANRPLTIRECARIQTFPDNFVFLGTQSEQAQQIGNAVPPKLALSIARCIIHDLDKSDSELSQGQLLSFVPTLSEGMSPALKNTMKLVEERFFSARPETISLFTLV